VTGSKFLLKRAAITCNEGGVIAYPTESVFGLGCDPLNQKAVYKILQLKNRSADMGLILIASNIEQLVPFIDISPQQKKQLKKTTTAPITWLVKASKYTPEWITGKHSQIAIRITQHPVCQQLCGLTNYPLVSTSANPSGLRPAKNNLQVIRYFGNSIDFLLPGKTGGRDRPTEIRDLGTDKIIRKG
jgi:L-threonylcarbamoyladenylate synthase